MHKKKTIDKILKLKDSRKKEVEIEVKKAADRVDEEKSKLDTLEQHYMNTFECFKAAQEEGESEATNIISYYEFFSRINGRINEQKKIHLQSENNLESLKDNLVEAHKDKRIFEILQDRIIKQNIKDEIDSEQKEADFLSIARKLR